MSDERRPRRAQPRTPATQPRTELEAEAQPRTSELESAGPSLADTAKQLDGHMAALQLRHPGSAADIGVIRRALAQLYAAALALEEDGDGEDA